MCAYLFPLEQFYVHFRPAEMRYRHELCHQNICANIEIDEHAAFIINKRWARARKHGCIRDHTLRIYIGRIYETPQCSIRIFRWKQIDTFVKYLSLGTHNLCERRAFFTRARDIFVKGHGLVLFANDGHVKPGDDVIPKWGDDGGGLCASLSVCGRAFRAKCSRPSPIVRDMPCMRQKYVRAKIHGKLMIRVIFRYLREVFSRDCFYDRHRSPNYPLSIRWRRAPARRNSWTIVYDARWCTLATSRSRRELRTGPPQISRDIPRCRRRRRCYRSLRHPSEQSRQPVASIRLS